MYTGIQELADRIQRFVDSVSWGVTRSAVDVVRYQPRRAGLVLASAVGRPRVPPHVARWITETQTVPAYHRLVRLPHALVRFVAGQATRWLGPSASTVIRFASGAAAAASDGIAAQTIQRSFSTPLSPGILVPHPHDIGVLAVDMRGFSNLTRVLQDSQYLAKLIEEYLTALTSVVERHRGFVFQYTGDGLIAIFLPEFAATTKAEMWQRLVERVSPELHLSFEAIHQSWQSEWREQGRKAAKIGFGVGMSFGCATVGFLGPSGKKQVGAIGEPVNQAAFLCSQAKSGQSLIDLDSFTRAGLSVPSGRRLRLRSKKPHQRVEALSLERTHRLRAEATTPSIADGAMMVIGDARAKNRAAD